MGKKRTQYSIDFKVKIALGEICGDKTVLQLAARYGVQPTQINTWIYYLIEHAAELVTQSKWCKERICYARR